MPVSSLPNSEIVSKSLCCVFKSSKIFLDVSGKNGSINTAAIRTDSNKLYRTVARRSILSESFASAHGVVSSIYLLHLENKSRISWIASATLSSSIFSMTFFTVPVATAFSSSSIGSLTFGFATTPPKYLFCMEIVRFTKLPRLFARSLLIRSIIRSYVTCPSCANGISCNMMKRTASTPNNFTKSSA